MYENTTSSSKFELKVGHYYPIERRVNLEYKPEQIPGNKEGGTVILAISSAVTAELPNQETRRQSTSGEPRCGGQAQPCQHGRRCQPWAPWGQGEFCVLLSIYHVEQLLICTFVFARPSLVLLSWVRSKLNSTSKFNRGRKVKYVSLQNLCCIVIPLARPVYPDLEHIVLKSV